MSEQPPRPLTLMERRKLEREKPAVKPAEKREEMIDVALIAALKSDDRYHRFLEHTPETAIGNQTQAVARFLDNVNLELAADPATESRFTRILLEHDPVALQENSERQLKAIKNARRDLLGEEDEKEAARVKSFKELVTGMRPVRADKMGGTYTQFESPRRVGKTSSFGPQDTAIQADRYIYGSFDVIRHNMAGNALHTHYIDEGAISASAEIVMQDIANVIARENHRPIAHYLNNLFNYHTGKKILAQYLALVFITPEEAVRFLSKNNSPRHAQRWDDDILSPIPAEVPYIPKEDEESAREKWMRAENDAVRRAEEITAMMKQILEKTGIEPPLSLEVRIPDIAPITR